jgi:hypothetical protein
MKSLKKQVGGKHYQDFAIPPVEFIQQNRLGFIEGCIIKYLCRYKKKHADPRLQLVDLQKAQHYLEMLVEMTAANKIGVS